MNPIFLPVLLAVAVLALDEHFAPFESIWAVPDGAML
jgi:hypothetical protein